MALICTSVVVTATIQLLLWRDKKRESNDVVDAPSDVDTSTNFDVEYQEEHMRGKASLQV